MPFIPKEKVNPDQQTFDEDRNVPDWDAKTGFRQATKHAQEQARTARNLNRGRKSKYGSQGK